MTAALQPGFSSPPAFRGWQLPADLPTGRPRVPRVTRVTAKLLARARADARRLLAPAPQPAWAAAIGPDCENTISLP